MQAELLADTSRHRASFALPPLDLSSSTFFFGLARVRKQEVRNLFELGFVFSTSSSFFFSTRGHHCRSTVSALLAVVEKATGVGGLRAEMVKGVGASFAGIAVELVVSLDRGIVRTGLGGVVGGCDFMVELQLFREVGLFLE